MFADGTAPGADVESLWRSARSAHCEAVRDPRPPPRPAPLDRREGPGRRGRRRLSGPRRPARSAARVPLEERLGPSSSPPRSSAKPRRSRPGRGPSPQGVGIPPGARGRAGGPGACPLGLPLGSVLLAEALDTN